MINKIDFKAKNLTSNAGLFLLLENAKSNRIFHLIESFKTTQVLRDINFKVFKKLLSKSKLKSITIDIDSSVINVEGHQEGAVKGYNPKNRDNRCYNIQFSFCDELKAYITGFVRSGDTYTANGAAEMIKEIIANIKSDDLEDAF